MTVVEIKINTMKIYIRASIDLILSVSFLQFPASIFQLLWNGGSAIILPQKRAAKVQRMKEKKMIRIANLGLIYLDKKEKQEARKRRFKPNTISKKIKKDGREKYWAHKNKTSSNVTVVIRKLTL